MNLGTVPAYILTLLWLVGTAGFVVRPPSRPLILRFQLIILTGYPAAMIWSLVSGFVLRQRGDPLEQFDPFVRMFDACDQTTGLIGLYAVMWSISGGLWVAAACKKKQNRSCEATGDNVPS